LLFTTVSAIGSAILYALFGETQIDELQRMIGRPLLGRDVLLTLQLIFVFLLAMVLGAPPFHGLFSVGRFGGTPQTRAFVTSIFGLTGAAVFMRWALAVFSRSGVGGLDLEPLGPLNILEVARWVFAASLIAIPIVCIATGRLEQSIRLFSLNAFSQGLFCITLGTRETVAFGLGQCLIAGLLNSFILAAFLELPGAGLRMTRQEWVGVGRVRPWAVVLLLLGMAAIGGFPPFWGSLMIQRALGANTWWGGLLIINILLSGVFLMRLSLLAFQRSPAVGDSGSPTSIGGVTKLSWHHGLWIGFQFALLISLGIVWHPLYKFALMSNRAFFGEL
jgi:NADH:ubiquinone oxidoreductase subunit 2 (subunit N)